MLDRVRTDKENAHMRKEQAKLQDPSSGEARSIHPASLQPQQCLASRQLHFAAKVAAFAQPEELGRLAYHSPLLLPRPSPLAPCLLSRPAFWPAAAEAKLDGRFEGMVTFQRMWETG